MNQGRIWCVVNPTVGLPLFLGSVAVTSLIVHASVLGNTTWFGAYWNGKAKPKTASVEMVTPPVATSASGFTISVSPVAGNGETSFVISVAPKSATPAEATVDATPARSPEPLALASPQLR